MISTLTPLLDPARLDLASSGFVILCAGLVLMMTVPGLALFYGGLTRATSVLNMMMMSFGATGVVGVLFILYGYSMSFGSRDLLGILSSPFDKLGLSGTGGLVNPLGHEGYGAIPELGFVGFQLTFAVIAVALISGTVADRVKFSTWLVFAALWVTLVYFPLAHMVWGSGLLSASSSSVSALLFGSTKGVATLAPIDFAGGTVVHINAGMAALVLAVVTGRRLGFGSTVIRPHNVPLVMVGAGLLWFGWFGFNAGSELAPDGRAALVWVNTTAAACAAMVGWLLVEKVRDGHPTSVGAASGVVAGLVAITPACGALSPVGSLALGVVAGGLCAYAVGLKLRFGLDDSLDVVGVHLVAGLWGTVGAGLLSTTTGLLYGRGWQQTALQAILALASVVFSGVVTLGIAVPLQRVLGWRISADAESVGIDPSEHAETAYDLLSRAHRLRGVVHGPVPTAVPTPYSADPTISTPALEGTP